MVKPGGTGRPALVISATPAPLPPSRLRIEALPSSKRYTHFGARVRRFATAAPAVVRRAADARPRPPPAPFAVPEDFAVAGAFFRVVVVLEVVLTAIVLLVSVRSRAGAGSVPPYPGSGPLRAVQRPRPAGVELLAEGVGQALEGHAHLGHAVALTDGGGAILEAV